MKCNQSRPGFELVSPCSFPTTTTTTPRAPLIVFVMGGKWPYSCCFVECCLQDLFNIAHSILVLLPSSFFFKRLVSIHVVNPYSSIDTTAAWKKLRFILSVRSDFNKTDSLSIAVHAFASHVLTSVSVQNLINLFVNLFWIQCCLLLNLSTTIWHI